MYKFCKTEQSFQRQRELEQGLLAMMEHSLFEEISVSDLCSRMEIPRKSFYRYFSSKDGALFALLDHTLMEFFDASSLGIHRGGAAVEDLERFFLFCKNQKKLVDALQRSNLNGLLVERAVSITKQENLIPGYWSLWDETMRDLSMSFVVCGLMSMMIQWHHEGYRIPAEQMAGVAVAMLTQPLIPGMKG